MTATDEISKRYGVDVQGLAEELDELAGKAGEDLGMIIADILVDRRDHYAAQRELFDRLSRRFCCPGKTTPADQDGEVVTDLKAAGKPS